MEQLTFGFSLVPGHDIGRLRELVAVAEEDGLELVGVQDHPYAPSQVDTFSLIADLLARTSRISAFPDVANLPLRPPAMLAKAAATLDLMSGGRFELGLGAGANWSVIARMGGPRRTAAEANAALAEAVAVIRAMWAPEGAEARVAGEYYAVEGLRPGPAPAHPIGIWLGSQGPNALRLAGRIADGWAAPIVSYLPYEKWPEANAIIDGAAVAAGREPSTIRRIAQLVGTVTERPDAAQADTGQAPVRGTPEQWVEVITRLAVEQPFTTFVFWPETQSVEQVRAFARDVVPAVRQRMGATAS